MLSGNLFKYVYDFGDNVDRTEVETKGMGDMLVLLRRLGNGRVPVFCK